jgi:TonB-linked SusC/RagA family outer membrane protein
MANRFVRAVLGFTLLGGLARVAAAQEPATISGLVKNENGLPIASAQIVAEGLGLGAASRDNGRYIIFVPGSRVSGQQITLTARSIGYKPVSTTITLRAGLITADFTLAVNPLRLGEVVVTGAGTQTTNEKLGNVISSVSGATIDKSQETNVVSALAAKTPNVVINQSSGDPGSSAFVQIRGIKTIQGNSQPLIVVDGVAIDNGTNVTNGDVTAGTIAVNRAADINPADIETIDILKGAAASAIYGARAGAGVILITTKSGHAGETRYNFRSSMSMDKVDRVPDLQRMYGHGSGGTAAVCAAPGCRLTGSSWGPKLAAGTVTYDHANEFFDTGKTYDNTMSISGGSDKTTFYLSMGRSTQDGIIKGPNNAYNRTSVLLKGTNEVNSKLRVGGTFNFVDARGDFIQRGSNTSGLLLGGWRSPPNFNDAYYIDSTTGTQRSYRYPRPLSASDFSTRTYDNPYWTMNKNTATSQVGRSFGSVNAEYQPTTWLNVRYTLGADYSSDERLEPLLPSSAAQPLGRIDRATYTNYQVGSNLIAVGTHRFSDKVNATFTLGQDLNSRSYKQNQMRGEKFIVPDQLQLNNTTDFVPNEYESLIKSESYFFLGTLDLSTQLFLQAGARNDASSAFGKSAGRAWFPKVSASWLITDALHATESGFFNSGKVRAAYGVAGREPNAYQIYSGYTTGTLSDNWGPTLSPNQAGSGGLTTSGQRPQPDLKPERNAEFEVGTDLSLLANKVDASLTYYKGKSTDVILALPLPPSTGYTSQAQNAGTIENSGLELSANWRVVSKPSFSWEVGAQYGQNANKVTALRGAKFVYYGGTTGFGFDPVAMPGYAVGSWYDYDLARCRYGEDNVVGGVDINAACKASNAPNHALYIGADGFPIGDDKQRIQGNPLPKWTAGITTNITLNKKWRFSALFDIRHGNKIWNGTRGALDNFGVAKETEIRDDPTQVFGKTFYPGPVTGPGAGKQVTIGQDWFQGLGSSFTGYGAQFMEDASFVKLREVSVAYTLDQPWVGRILGARSLDVRLSGRNLALWTKYKGIDPEGNLTGTDASRGLDWFGNPLTKSYVLTFSLNR